MKSETRRVLQVGKFYNPDKGGIESITKAICDGLPRELYHVDVLCFKRKKGTQRIVDGHSFILKCGTFFNVASTPISLKFFYWFRKLRNDYDILHIHVPNPLAAIALFMFSVKGKVVIHWHSDIVNHKLLHFFLSFFERKMLKRADLILGTSPVYIQHSTFLRPFLSKAGYLSGGSDPQNFAVNMNRVREIKLEYDHRKIIFSLGRFIYYKGYEFLIEAAKYLSNDHVIVIGGGGPLKEKYLNLIAKLELYNRVFIVNDISQEDVGNYFEACDIFCLPSNKKTEAFGLVLVEAMIFGKPIVATNIPGSGTSWVNAHGVTGLNVEPNNSKMIADAIFSIMSSESQYLEYCKNSKMRFHEKFSNEKIIEDLSRHYSRLLNQGTIVKHISKKVI
jgi:glycosyltransferase involved in cell wall biosynthesis